MKLWALIFLLFTKKPRLILKRLALGYYQTYAWSLQTYVNTINGVYYPNFNIFLQLNKVILWRWTNIHAT